MKHIFIFLSLFLSFSVTHVQTAYAQSIKWKTEITDPYIDALNALAQVSPIIGSDSESYWAAHTVDSLSQVYKQKAYNYYEQMAFCNYCQKLITYSLSYFIGIIGAYHDADLSFNNIKDIYYSSCNDFHFNFSFYKVFHPIQK